MITTSQIPSRNSPPSAGNAKTDTPIAFQESRHKDFPKEETVQ